MIHSTRLVLLAIVASAVLAIAGCSSQGGKQTSQDSSASAPMTIAMVTHAQPGDAFWDLIRQGAKDAAEKNNVKLVYSSDPQANNQATLIQNAIDQKVDGLAVTLPTPEALIPAIQKAQAAQIPTVGFNAGMNSWKAAGVLGYFGSDEIAAGTQFGQRLNQIGSKHVLCVIHAQGQVSLEDRCAGVKKGFSGQTDTIYVNGENMPDVKTTISAKLQQDPSIDQVATPGAAVALTALQSAEQAGSHAKVATFDTNKEVVRAVKDGRLEWAVDQQPYLQGYMAVEALRLHKHNGAVFGGNSLPVLTGPAFVDKSNVDAIADFAAKGTR